MDNRHSSFPKIWATLNESVDLLEVGMTLLTIAVLIGPVILLIFFRQNPVVGALFDGGRIFVFWVFVFWVLGIFAVAGLERFVQSKRTNLTNGEDQNDTHDD